MVGHWRIDEENTPTITIVKNLIVDAEEHEIREAMGNGNLYFGEKRVKGRRMKTL